MPVPATCRWRESASAASARRARPRPRRPARWRRARPRASISSSSLPADRTPGGPASTSLCFLDGELGAGVGHRDRMRLVAFIAALLLLAREVPAQVVTFGADLTLEPNVPFDCSVWPIPSPFVPGAVELVPTQAQSCTWTTISVGPTTAHTLFVPAGNGTVTQVRVKVGPTTGPMQVVVLQALRQPPNPDPGCCQQVGQSDVFTPQPNAITTIPVALPVRADITPDQNNIYAFDILGLSILAPMVPIPAFDTGNYTPTGASDLADFPASQPGASISPTDPFGFELLMNADWIPSAATAPGPPAGGPPTTSGPIRIPSAQAVLQANNAIIDVTCTLAGPCPGRVRLQNAQAPGAIDAASREPGAIPIRTDA